MAEAMGDNIYGCDICQKVCPFNRFAKPNNTPDFAPSDDFLQLDREALEKMTEEDFRIIFRKSAVKRAGFSGLKRNLKMSALRAK